jgi:hypothetical protein
MTGFASYRGSVEEKRLRVQPTMISSLDIVREMVKDTSFNLFRIPAISGQRLTAYVLQDWKSVSLLHTFIRPSG